MFSFGKSTGPWMRNDSSAMCLICGESFNAYRRRHHCRKCYRLVCHDCSSHKVLNEKDNSLERICDDCMMISDQSTNSHHQLYDNIQFNIIVHEAHLIDKDFNSSSQTNIDIHSPRKFYFQILFAEKVIFTSTVHSIFDLNWANEVVPIRLDYRHALYVGVELYEKGRVTDDLLGRGRIALLSPQISSFQWLQLSHNFKISQNSNIINKLWISIHLDDPRDDIIEKFLLATHLHLLRVRIPLGITYQIGMNENIQNTQCIPFVSLFKPNTNLFNDLFIPFHKSSSNMHSPHRLHFQVIPYNELLLEAIEKIHFVPSDEKKKVSGVLFLTTHRCVFISYGRNARNKEPHHVLQMGLANVANCVVKRSERNTKLEIAFRNEILFKFKIPRSKTDDVLIYDTFQRMRAEMLWSVCEDNFSCLLNSLHTSNIQEAEEQYISPIDETIMVKEYQRMGISDSKLWRVTKINEGYAVCPSYPDLIAVPASIEDETLRVAATQRSHMV